MGTLYEHGEEVDRDLAQALTLYEAACDDGHGKSCTDARPRALAGFQNPARQSMLRA